MPSSVTTSDSRKILLLRRWARVAALLVMALGVGVQVGWMTGISFLTTPVPGWVAMKVNTAVLFSVAGWTLFILTPARGEAGPRRRAAATLAAGVVIAVAALTGVEHISGANLGIDNAIFADTSPPKAGYKPGRMAPISVANFILIGTALMTLAHGRPPQVTQLLAAATGFLSLVVLTGTSYGIEALIGKMHYTAVALHTNVGFMLMFAGILCATGDAGIMRRLTDPGAVGKVLRRLLPTAIAVPLLVSSFFALLEHDGFIGMELGVSLFSITTIVAFTVLVWQSGSYLVRSEQDSLRTGQRLRESLDRYRFLSEKMPEILWTATPAGAADYFNQRWYDYTGLTPEQSLGRAWTAAVHPDDLAKTTERWTQSTRTGWPYEVEYRFRGTDGTYRWFLGRGFPMRNDEGGIVQWLGMCTAIDDQLRTRAELEDRVTARTAELDGARKRLQAVLDSSTQVAIIATSSEGVITVFNRGAENMLGYTAAEIVGRHTPEIWHVGAEVMRRGEELSRELGRPIEGFDALTHHAREKGFDEREWTFVRKDGSRLTVNLITTAARDAAGNLGGFLGLATDITARRQAERTLRDQALILDLANDTIFIRDNRDRIIYWNQGAERLYGWTREEALGRVTHELFQTEFPVPLAAIQQQMMETGHWKGELVHTNRGDEILTVASSWTLQRDANGRPASVIEMNYDITARKKAEAELDQSRVRMDAILRSSLDGIITYDVVRGLDGRVIDLRYTMINPAAEKLMQHRGAELVGHSLREAFPNVVADGLFEKFAGIVESNEPLDFEHRSTRTGTPRWYRIAGAKLGEGLVISYQEITTRKLQEQQLREAKENAELADRAKSDFLANMSHEIRTPMNGVIGLSGLLMETDMNAEQRGLAETIRTSAESLLTVINDILDFSKIEAGKLTFEQIDFDLRKVVEDVLEILASQAQRKNIELIGAIDPNLPTRLRGDPGRVSQVLTNLLSNALKFTSKGEVVVRVEPEVCYGDRLMVRFTIRDTGPGIPAHVQERLFQPFVQADTSTSRQFGGTGLGLAICKRLAEAMHGRIGVESEVGLGSTFWVLVEFMRQAAAMAETVAPDEFADLRVLIVDDNATSREVLRRQVESWRLETVCAANADEALDCLRRGIRMGKPCDVALVDLEMPSLDGLGLAQKIAADANLAATRVVLMTPLGKPVPSDGASAATIAACCVKPVRQSALFDCLVQARRGVQPMGQPRRQTRFSAANTSSPRRQEAILLAEDNLVNQEVALGNLHKLGYEADVVANGLEVLDAMEARRYDIILMDCQMPELDGYETTRQLRLRERDGQHARIIAMTANAMVGDREKCLAAGMDDYVSKPLHRAELKAALERGSKLSAKPFTEAMLRSLTGDHMDELARMVELFVKTAPDSIADMRGALANKDAAALAMAAHTLKGSCSNFGALPLRELCARLEADGRAGQLGAAHDLVASADQELQRLNEALRAHVEFKHVA
jgi:PAS domain S-box-containing protein